MLFWRGNPLVALFLFDLFGLTTSTPALPISGQSLSAPSEPPSLILPTNLTLSRLSKAIPPDPFIYHVPQTSDQTIKLHSYRSRLSKPDTGRCLLAAINEAIQHISGPGEGDDVIEDEQEYHCGDVELAIYPWRDDFTWTQWAHTTGAIYWFVTTYGFWDMEFEIKVITHRDPIGKGRFGKF